MPVKLHLSNGIKYPVPTAYKKSSEVLEFMKQFGPDGYLTFGNKEDEIDDVIFIRHIVMIEETEE